MNFPKTVKEHYDRVAQCRCVVTGNPTVTVHHCHGGSMKEASHHSGGAQRGISDALVLPLKAGFHFGDDGIDNGVGVETWELWYGTQMDHLKELGDELGYDLFQLHEIWKQNPPPRG